MQLNEFFKDLKIIELASVLAGPSVGMFFAELGAEVLKIENKSTQGDVTRKWKLSTEDKTQTDSAYYHSINWGKQKLFLDLSTQKDRNILQEKIKTADIVLSNFKPDSAKKLQLTYLDISMLNPQIIYAAISAYGPQDTRPGFDALMQAESGWMSMNGEKNGKAVKLPVALMDVLSAHQLKQGILVALIHRMRTGKGSEVQVSLFDSAVSGLVNQASNWLNEKHIPQKMGSRHPNIAPYGDIIYSKDNKAILLSTGTEKHFTQLLKSLNLENKSHFQDNQSRLIHRDELVDYLNKGAAHFHSTPLLENFKKNGVPAALIKNIKEVFENPLSEKLLLQGKKENGEDYQVVKSVVFNIS